MVSAVEVEAVAESESESQSVCEYESESESQSNLKTLPRGCLSACLSVFCLGPSERCNYDECHSLPKIYYTRIHTPDSVAESVRTVKVWQSDFNWTTDGWTDWLTDWQPAWLTSVGPGTKIVLDDATEMQVERPKENQNPKNPEPNTHSTHSTYI